MTAKTRFLNSIITAAQDHRVVMPWTRGPARQASIARRRNPRDATADTTTAAVKSA